MYVNKKKKINNHTLLYGCKKKNTDTIKKKNILCISYNSATNVSLSFYDRKNLASFFSRTHSLAVIFSLSLLLFVTIYTLSTFILAYILMIAKENKVVTLQAFSIFILFFFLILFFFVQYPSWKLDGNFIVSKFFYLLYKYFHWTTVNFIYTYIYFFFLSLAKYKKKKNKVSLR